MTVTPSAVVGPAADIRRALERAQHVLVASHIDPDGDALGTQLAMGQYLRDLGKNVTMTRDSEIPDKYSWLPGVDQIVPAGSLSDAFSIDTAVILECPTLLRIGSARALLTSKVTVINIDHHRDNAEFGTINWLNRDASSVGEMIYEYFQQVGYRINAETAVNLYTAILTDTGRFRYNSTSARTMHIVGELIAAGANPRQACDNVYYCMQPSAMKLTGRVLNSIEYFDHDRICVLSLTKDMLDHSGATEAESDGLVDFTLFTKGVQAGMLLKELNTDRTKVSLRSANGIDVSSIAGRYGGGGHFNAAGCIVPLGLEQAKAELINILREARRAV